MKFKTKLNEMLKDERKAPVDYSQLKRLSKSPSVKNTISKIIHDEKHHYKLLSKIKSGGKR